MKKIAIIMGSDSDMPVAEKAADTLRSFGVPFEVHIFSAHRTPEEAKEFSASARENGFGAVIAAAGMAAHLAGASAANTTLPVIGIPVRSAGLGGIDALLSTAKGSEYDKVQSLDLGADDYLTKPFGMMEMVSRVNAVLRRCGASDEKNVLKAGGLVLDDAARTVTVDGEKRI